MEFNCEVWSPEHLQDIDRVENIQRTFTKRIAAINTLSYLERLDVCGLESLEMRRMKRDLILVYKIIKGLVGLNFDDFFKYAPSRALRGHSLEIVCQHTGLVVVHYTFLLVE